MNKNAKNVGKALFFLSLFFSCTALFGQSLNVEAPNVVEKGEVFRIVYSADTEIEDFQLPVLSGLELIAGPIPSRSSGTTIVNGKRTDYMQISYSIMVRATAVGLLKIDPAQCKINGTVQKSRSLEIEVVQGSGAAQSSDAAVPSKSTGEVSSDDIFLRLVFSKTNVVVGEPIVATLKLYTRVGIGGFEDVKFPVFNGFWSQEMETPQNINFVRENYNNKIYNSAVLRKYMLLPQQSGTLTIDPAYMVCQVEVMRGSNSRRSIFDDFFDTYQTVRKRVSTNSAKINVSPLPGGAPASFGGGVGEFSMSVKLNRDSIKAHEAGSLLVEISGSGNMNLIETPQVMLPNDFEKYDVKTTDNFSNGASGLAGKKSFEFPFIPRSSGRFVIPPIEYSYYNIKQNKYVTLRSDSLVLKVSENENAAAAGQSVIAGIGKQSVVNLGSDIRYIFTSWPQLAKKGFFVIWSWKMLVAVLAVITLYFVADYMLRERAKLKGDIKRTRNRRANKVAKSRLKLAQSYMAQGLHSPFYEELHKALLGYISDKLSIQFVQMQRDTIEQTLRSKGVSDENITAFMQLLDECELARYSQQQESGAMETQYDSAIKVISNLENRL